MHFALRSRYTERQFSSTAFALKPLQFGSIAVVWDATEHHETNCYALQRISEMPVLIDGVRYFSAIEMVRELGVSRSTFWRWRAAREIPSGRRYRRGKMVLFTEEEFAAVREFANRLEPVQGSNRDQMKLFNGVR
jgi:predicted DNA-binding transcriptional regulator AlpA